MIKTIILMSLFALIAGSCAPEKKRTEDTGVLSLPDTILLEDKDTTQTANIYSIDTIKIMIDNSFFEKEEVQQIYYSDSEYEKYGIPKLNTQGMTSEARFVYDDTNVSFSIIEEIKLYDHIYSLIIRGTTEHVLGIWLVNYDLNHTYIDSYPVGYDEWAESASRKTSVIYILPKPYIEEEYVSWEDKENSRIEVLEPGKFEVVQTIHSKYEM